MAIGVIKSVSVVDGQITAVIETGSGPAVTAVIMAGSGSEFYPLAGDTALFRHDGHEVIVSAVWHGLDAQTAAGEGIIFARDSAGAVISSVHCKVDGSVVVGAGSDFVAMSTPLNTFLSALSNAVAPGGDAVATPAPGTTCPVAAAIYAAMLSAFPPSGQAACGSANLKAE